MPALAPITITGLADKTGVDVKSIRSYERLGFLTRPRRGPGGHWLYNGEDVESLTFISRTQRLGFSVEMIGELLELAGKRNESACGQLRQMAVRRLTSVRGKIAELTRMEQALSLLTHTCAQSEDIARCPVLMSLTQPG